MNGFVAVTINFVVCAFYTTVVRQMLDFHFHRSEKKHSFPFFSFSLLLFFVFFCVFLSPLQKGGFKAVLWTDAFQFCMMMLSMAIVIIKGNYDVGGVSAVFNASLASNRIEFLECVPLPISRDCVRSLFVFDFFFLLIQLSVSGSIPIPR